jgi:erythromycin esterase-like protein
MRGSIAALLDYLEKVDPQAAKVARERYGCLTRTAIMEIKRVRPSHQDSYERQCHDSGVKRFLLDFDRAEAVLRRLREERLERFIGVIYRHDTELMSHYASASLSRQFDAFVWFDHTQAVTPLGPQHIKAGVPEHKGWRT